MVFRWAFDAARRWRPIAISLAAGLVLLASPVRADDKIAEFYAGKTITILIGVSAGAGVDLFGRMLARHLGDHVPGKPKVIATNMAGAGSKIAAKHLYSIAPKDGTFMGTILPGALMEPLRIESVRKDYDPTKFNYVGNGTDEVLVAVSRMDSPVKSLADAFKSEWVVGTPGGGSAVHEAAMVYKNLLNAKVRIVTGYPGVREVGLAVEKGEVQGMIAMPYSTARKFFPGYLTGEKGFKVIAQEDLKGHPELNKAGVPRSITMAKPGEDHDAMEVFQTQSVLVRTYIMPPGVPAERVEAMRQAFMETVKSPEFQRDFETAVGEPATPEPGDKIAAAVARMYASPPNLIARIAKAIEN